MSEHLSITPESFVKEEPVELVPVIEEIVEEIEDDNPPEHFEEVTEIVEEENEEVVEDIPKIIPKKGPRKAQRMKRRKAVHSKIMTDRETRLAGLAAVKNRKEIGDLPRPSLPKTAIGIGMKEHFLKFQSRFRAVLMMQQDKNLLSVHINYQKQNLVQNQLLNQNQMVVRMR